MAVSIFSKKKRMAVSIMLKDLMNAAVTFLDMPFTFNQWQF
jgi:hypothetical protein